MWGREEEIGVGQQIGWHGDCAMQVILDRRRTPAQLWLRAFAEGKAEVQFAAGSGELEFPGQLPELRPPSAATKPSPWALQNASQDLRTCSSWRPGFGQCKVQAPCML